VRGWDKNWPSRLLRALPKRSWLKRLRRLGLDVRGPLWRYAASASAATRSRWQWTWVGDDSVFKKYGDQLGLVDTWWSGQEHGVLSGIDGVLLVVVIGEGKLVVPVDFAIRRPDPQGPGGPCRDKLHWLQVMLDGRQVNGSDLQQPSDWPWRESPQVPGVRYMRLRATSPTYGPVINQYYLMCLETDISVPRLIRAWKRRHWIEHCFRTLYGLLCPLILLYGRGSVSRKRSAADSVMRQAAANAYLTVSLPRLALKR
jgi:hypothetical protein